MALWEIVKKTSALTSENNAPSKTGEAENKNTEAR